MVIIVDKKLNELLKQKRKERGLRIVELSQALNIPKSTISRIENKYDLNTSNKNVKRLLDFFSIKLTYDSSSSNREIIDITDYSPVHKMIIQQIKDQEEVYQAMKEQKTSQDNTNKK